ncbi:MAG: hypothetical protein ACI3XH_06830 [Phascolarctobacterium sp.]
MATTSFFKQVIIKDSKDCEALVNAFENAMLQQSDHANVPKPLWAKPEDIKNMTFELGRQ